MSDGSSPQCAAGSMQVIQFSLEGGDMFLGGWIPFHKHARVLLHLLQLQVQSNKADIWLRTNVASGPAADVGRLALLSVCLLCLLKAISKKLEFKLSHTGGQPYLRGWFPIKTFHAKVQMSFPSWPHFVSAIHCYGRVTVLPPYLHWGKGEQKPVHGVSLTLLFAFFQPGILSAASLCKQQWGWELNH